MSASDEPFAHPPKGGASSAAASAGRLSQLEFDIAFYESVLQRAPDYVDVLRCQGELLTRKGSHAQALAIDRRLAVLLPDDCVVQYNLACSLALMGMRNEAVAALRCALEAGYDDFDYLEADSDLDALRDEGAYQALLREFLPKE
jgi:tetratricopeptide (TPR) repeat protein